MMLAALHEAFDEDADAPSQIDVEAHRGTKKRVREGALKAQRKAIEPASQVLESSGLTHPPP